MSASPALLEIEGLRVVYPLESGSLTALGDLRLTLRRGEILGIVGESGAGKSTIGHAITGLIDPPGYIASGEIRLDGVNLTALQAEELRGWRGRRIGSIFQDPMTALDPLMTIGRQLTETIQLHLGLSLEAARERAIVLLGQVGIPQPEMRLGAYPFEFSGGMRQRVVIAIAISAEPALLIADEPTTALDVTVQSQILSLISQLRRERGLGVLLVTHDVGVVAEVADRVMVMAGGRVVEEGVTAELLSAPKMPYTQRLLASVPPLTRRLSRFALPDEGSARSESRSKAVTEVQAWYGARRRDADGVALEVTDLSVRFQTHKSLLPSRRRYLHAVNAVNLKVQRGEVLGLVGESGSGKSTLARAIAGLLPIHAGRVVVRDAAEADGSKLQMVFQDPYASLNPRQRIGAAILEPIRVLRLAHGSEREHVATALLRAVGLLPADRDRLPHQFSGGQRQRICIARALATRPGFIIFDEPTSSLDVSIQAEILNLMKDLQEALALTFIFISHNLAVVRQICDRVAVMRAGEICELAPSEELFDTPRHPYTRALIDNTPKFGR